MKKTFRTAKFHIFFDFLSKQHHITFIIFRSLINITHKSKELQATQRIFFYNYNARQNGGIEKLCHKNDPIKLVLAPNRVQFAAKCIGKVQSQSKLLWINNIPKRFLGVATNTHIYFDLDSALYPWQAT